MTRIPKALRPGAKSGLVTDKKAKFKPLRHMVFFDTETLPDNNDVHRAYLTCAVIRKPGPGGKGWIYEDRSFWGDGTEFMSETLKIFTKNSHKTRHVTYIAHNAGFDFMSTGMHNHLLADGFELSFENSIISETSSPLRLEYRKTLPTPGKDGRVYHHVVTIIDNGNYYGKTPLAALGSKGAFEFHDNPDVEDFNRSRRAANNPQGPEGIECEAYCAQDVKVLRDSYEAIEEFMSVNELGALEITIASTALSVFRTRFLPLEHAIEIHNNPRIFALEEASYSGGAVFARRLVPTEQPFDGHQVDVTSMYPDRMRNTLMPISVKRFYPAEGKQPTVDELLDVFENGHVAISRVNLTIPEESPFADARFPVRTEDKLLFPLGSFETTLAGDELKDALASGYVTSISETCTYFAAYIFVEYVDFFANLKAQYAHLGNSVFEGISKLFMNALYGKWAMTIESFEELTNEDDDYDVVMYVFERRPDMKYYTVCNEHGVGVRYKRVFGKILRSRLVRTSSRFTNMAIASHITAAARSKLFRAAQSAGDAEFVYADTDSLIVSQIGYERLQRAGLIGKGLGYFISEFKISRLLVAGLKHYSLFGQKWSKVDEAFKPNSEYKRRHKGVKYKTDSKGNITNVNPDGTYNVMNVERLHARALTGATDGVKITKTVKKGEAAEYTKGVVDTDGWIRPYTLP